MQTNCNKVQVYIIPELPVHHSTMSKSSGSSERSKRDKLDILGELLVKIHTAEKNHPKGDEITPEILGQKSTLAGDTVSSDQRELIASDINRGSVADVDEYSFNGLLALVEWCSRTGTRIKSEHCLVMELVNRLEGSDATMANLMKILVVIYFYGHSVVENCSRNDNLDLNKVVSHCIWYILNKNRCNVFQIPLMLAILNLVLEDGEALQDVADVSMATIEKMAGVTISTEISDLALDAKNEILQDLAQKIELEDLDESDEMQAIQKIAGSLGLKIGGAEPREIYKWGKRGHFPGSLYRAWKDTNGDIICMTYNDLPVAYVGMLPSPNRVIYKDTSGPKPLYDLAEIQTLKGTDLPENSTDYVVRKCGSMIDIVRVEAGVSGRSLGPLCLLYALAYIKHHYKVKSACLENAAESNRNSVYQNLGFTTEKELSDLTGVEFKLAAFKHEFFIDVDRVTKEFIVSKASTFTNPNKLRIDNRDLMELYIEETKTLNMSKILQNTKYVKKMERIFGINYCRPVK